nr:EAL domain-containing protein [Sphingomicrobium lutaoense]
MSYAEEFEDRWFWETDAEGRLTYLSKNVAEQIEMFGIKTIGEPLASVFRLDQGDAQHSRSLNFHIVSRTSFSNYPVRGVRGLSESWWSMSGRPWFDNDGELKGFVGSGTDLTKTRKQEATIRRLALTDSLTGLANRQQMQDNLSGLLNGSLRTKPLCALMMLDLDGFKGVNDTLGHPVGDSLLIQVAERLSSAVAEVGIVGRLGGDEFQILVLEDRSRESLSRLGFKIIDEISAPYSVDGYSITISCSIGISLADADSNPETLVRNADIALYAAKASGRATCFFFEDEMLANAQRRKKLEDDLRTALSSDQFKLMYQPIVATQSEELTGFEALLRWTHPTEGDIAPSEFIPVAEDCGLIQQIGDWVIRSATRIIAELPEDLRVAVNVSAIQFSNPTLLSTLANAIAESQIDPSRLELEITESVFVDNEGRSEKTFRALKDLGVRLALDDFGTGYSSLSYLQDTPFDKIKIDQSFVRGAVDPRSRNSAIIESIVALSKALNMETTAEGVEHQDEIELIRKLGCSHIQGYVYGPAMDITDIIPKLRTGSRKMPAIGPKRSRSPRMSLVRSTMMTLNQDRKPVVVRNISETGALLDQVGDTTEMLGVTVLLDLLQHKLSEAKVRWVGDGRAGVEFHEPISLKDVEARKDGFSSTRQSA